MMKTSIQVPSSFSSVTFVAVVVDFENMLNEKRELKILWKKIENFLKNVTSFVFGTRTSSSSSLKCSCRLSVDTLTSVVDMKLL